MTITALSEALADRDLVVRAGDGDVLALDHLIAAVRTVVHRYCRARLTSYSGGAEVAEDVTQEVCLAVVDVLPRYAERGAPFTALVYAIAANKVADAQRRYARTPYHVVDELPDQVEPSLGPEQQTMASSDLRTALALLAQLPTRTAQVVLLRAEGLSADDVGVMLGLTANAVRVRQHRGLVRLRRLVETSAEHRERFAERRVGVAAA